MKDLHKVTTNELIYFLHFLFQTGAITHQQMNDIYYIAINYTKPDKT